MSDRRGDGSPFVPHRSLAHRASGQSGGGSAAGQVSSTGYEEGNEPVFDEQAADARARAQADAQQAAREAKEAARIQHEAHLREQQQARQQAPEPQQDPPADRAPVADGRHVAEPNGRSPDPEQTQEYAPVPAEDESDNQQTSPIAMAAAAVGAAKERIMGSRDNSDRKPEPAQTQPTDWQPQGQAQGQHREVPPSVVTPQPTVYPGNRPVMRPVTRRARLRLTRIDPWSVMKTSFLLSIAFGIMCVVAVFVIWSVLGAANVFGSINSTITDVLDIDFSVQDYVGIDRVMPIAILISVVNVVLITALCTLGSFLYNLAASLLGGLEVTLAEDQK